MQSELAIVSWAHIHKPHSITFFIIRFPQVPKSVSFIRLPEAFFR